MYSGLIDLYPIVDYFDYRVYIKVLIDYILTRLERQHSYI
jgi:hypothetical protein